MWHVFRLVVAGLMSTLLVFHSDIRVHPTEMMAWDQPAVYQQFEHGFMIALGSTVEVFTYNEKDQWGYRLSFTFYENDIALLEEAPVANLPPVRDYQPTGDFGKLWSNSPRIMHELGWAITPPIQYTA